MRSCACAVQRAVLWVPKTEDPTRLCAPVRLTRAFFLYLCSFNDSEIFSTALNYAVQIQPDLWICPSPAPS